MKKISLKEFNKRQTYLRTTSNWHRSLNNPLAKLTYIIGTYCYANGYFDLGKVLNASGIGIEIALNKK